MHEIGHALGFYHEHTRVERSQFIHINFDNIVFEAQPNFYTVDTEDFGVRYDLGSIMHYSSTVRHRPTILQEAHLYMYNVYTHWLVRSLS